MSLPSERWWWGQRADLLWPPGTAPFHLVPLEWPLCATVHSGHCGTQCWSGRTEQHCLSPGYSCHIYGTSTLLWQAETKTGLEQRLRFYSQSVVSPPSKNWLKRIILATLGAAGCSVVSWRCQTADWWLCGPAQGETLCKPQWHLRPGLHSLSQSPKKGQQHI